MTSVDFFLMYATCIAGYSETLRPELFRSLMQPDRGVLVIQRTMAVEEILKAPCLS